MDQKTRRIWTFLTISLALPILFLVAGHTIVHSARPSLLPDAPKQAPRSPNAASSWRSAWISITPGANITLTHNLGGDPDSYAVKLWFRDQDGDYGINARGYGGLEDGGDFYGAAWMNLSSNTIQVGRSINDTFADQVRVWVWIPDPAPDYCSVWTNLGVGETGVFTHGLGGDVDDYFSSLVFSSTLSGINQRAYGGFEYNSGSYAGAYWSNLTTSTVKVYRHANDPFASQVRVCVTQPDPPDYDSGWITVTEKSTETFAHNLGGMVSLYRVRLDVWTPVFGVNHRFAGGEMENVSPVGNNWQNLTNSTVQVYNHISSSRRVRLRIWDRNLKVYLPLVLNNYTPPTELAYDDGVQDSWQSTFTDAGFAARFSPPTTPTQVVGARYYLNTASASSIEVHVWDSDHSDLITPFTVAAPVGVGWLDVNLGSHDLTVNGDFYIGFLSAQDFRPDVGVDTTSPDGRSYEYPWQATSSDYMIRAWVTPSN